MNWERRCLELEVCEEICEEMQFCRNAECCGLEDMRGLGINVKSNFKGLTCEEIRRFL